MFFGVYCLDKRRCLVFIFVFFGKNLETKGSQQLTLISHSLQEF